MSEPMPFAKIRLSLMFAAEHELPIELGTDEVWSVLNKLDQLSAETGKAIARAEAAEQKLRELQAEIGRLQKLLNSWLALTHITPINQYSLDLRSETERAMKGGAG